MEYKMPGEKTVKLEYLGKLRFKMKQDSEIIHKSLLL